VVGARNPALGRRLLPTAVASGVLAGALSPSAAAAPPREPASDARFREGSHYWRCTDDVEPCHRPDPARSILLALGAVGGGVAASLLFALGDRLAPGDPATLLVGTGAVAGAGALIGFAAGRLGADSAAVPDRIRPATAGLDWTVARPANLDEAQPHTLSLRWAPTWRFTPGGARVRLIGHLGGWLNPSRQVDPRPQAAASADDREGTAPQTFRQRRLSTSVGLDFAVPLPYPVLRNPRRSAFLGPAELRWRPTFDIRREAIDLDGVDPRVVERTMLLPLTVGARWHLSPRQRFTFYAGPRFDMVAYADPGTDGLSRGRPQLSPLYGEAWYDIDVPLTSRHRDKPRLVDATGMLTMGYVHSRFDGFGLDFGPVVGFLGPVHVGWLTRIRPRGSKVAAQLGATGRIGNGFAGTLEVGIVVPDLGPGGRR
jgi:hypothetical protein